MSQSAIFFPVLVQALLSLLLLPIMGRARARSMRELGQKLTDKDVALGRNTWTEAASKIASNFKNQFEVPVLFFAVVAFALIYKQADAPMTGLAWVFAVSRLVHAAIHIGPNVVLWRAVAYLIGVVAVLAMWLLLGFRVWTGV